MILKPSMVIAGENCPTPASVAQVAEMTVRCLRNNVPASVAGIAFLSGGQANELATAHLNAIHTQFGSQCPWTVTFSYARAIQQPALDYWRGDDANIPVAQKLLYHRAKLNGAASIGQYTPAMEATAAVGALG